MTSKGVWGRLADWLDHRVGIRGILHEALYERIPGGSRWRYVWGSTLVFTFAVQVITGIFLWTAYSPSASTAWESVYYINNEMFLGGVVRGIHHFAAQAMVVLMALHLLQVIIDGAYKAPREINFWLGLILMLIVFGLSLTGYLLPWHQKGYYATRVSTNIAGATPLIGTEVQELIQGGPEYGHATLTRFFAMHAGILPGLLIGFLALHLYVFRRHGITPADPNRAPTATFWPDQLLKDSVACLAVMATVLFLAVYVGAEVGAPANPAENFDAARPEWYFLFLFRFLRFEWVDHIGVAFGAIYVPGALFTILVLMPFIAKLKHGHTFNRIFAWVLMLGVVGLTAVAIYEDMNDAEHRLALDDTNIEAERIQELVARPSKIPVAGAVSLLAKDPFVQGPKLFAKHCAACHRWDGHNGMRRLVIETVSGDEEAKQILSLATATDLTKFGRFGSREWMKSILTDYPQMFAPLMNAQWYEQAKQNGTLDEVLNPANSEMADFVTDNREYLIQNPDDLNALAEFFAKQSGRKDLEPIDEELAARGEAIANGEGELTMGCFDCHPGSPDAEGIGYPTLVQYGSAEWLKSFLQNPGHERHYGDKNQMPAYDNLSDADLDLLVRWIVRDYHPTEIELPDVRPPADVKIDSVEKSPADTE